MADPGSFLPVIRTIVTPDGASMTPADVLEIGIGLTIAYVPGPGVNGPARLVLAAVVVPAPDVLPFVLPVVQTAVAAGVASALRVLAFAAVGAPSTFTGAAFFSSAALTANDTNYASVVLQEYDETGLAYGSPIAGATITTRTSPTGTGNWAGGGAIAFDLGLGVDIASGHRLVAVWRTNHGAGVAVPAGEWRIT